MNKALRQRILKVILADDSTPYRGTRPVASATSTSQSSSTSAEREAAARTQLAQRFPIVKIKQDPISDKNIIEEEKKLIKSKGYEPGDVLGTGATCRVYSVTSNPDVVVKVTQSPRDILATDKVIEIKNSLKADHKRHIMNCVKKFEIQSNTIGNRACYVVNKLTELPDDYQKLLFGDLAMRKPESEVEEEMRYAMKPGEVEYVESPVYSNSVIVNSLNDLLNEEIVKESMMFDLFLFLRDDDKREDLKHAIFYELKGLFGQLIKKLNGNHTLYKDFEEKLDTELFYGGTIKEHIGDTLLKHCDTSELASNATCNTFIDNIKKYFGGALLPERPELEGAPKKLSMLKTLPGAQTFVETLEELEKKGIHFRDLRHCNIMFDPKQHCPVISDPGLFDVLNAL